ELDDLEFEVLALEVRDVAHRADVDERARQESADLVDVDRETALDLAADHAFDDFAGLERLLETRPGARTLRLLARQPGLAEAVLHRVEGDFDLVADGHFELAVVIVELLDGNHAFGLEAGVDDH